jgi:hypothetical protein
MPFTPFHFGVGIAAKAAFERRFSLTLFIALQIVIDLESLYNLAHGRYPVHRFLHTFVGAGLLALLSTALLFGVARFRGRGPDRRQPPARNLIPLLLATSLFATWSHVVLDGIMHKDAQPLWPMTDFNPFLSIIGNMRLHLACMILGFFGFVALVFQWSLYGHDTWFFETSKPSRQSSGDADER